MDSKMLRLLKILLTLLALLTILSASSCGRRIKFNPDAHRANHNIEAIVNERQEVIYCYEPYFSEFACMHKTKWIELRELLQNSPIEEPLKQKLIRHIDVVFK
jgi:hypothetical protein